MQIANFDALSLSPLLFSFFNKSWKRERGEDCLRLRKSGQDKLEEIKRERERERGGNKKKRKKELLQETVVQSVWYIVARFHRNFQSNRITLLSDTRWTFFHKFLPRNRSLPIDLRFYLRSIGWTLTWTPGEKLSCPKLFGQLRKFANRSGCLAILKAIRTQTGRWLLPELNSGLVESRSFLSPPSPLPPPPPRHIYPNWYTFLRGYREKKEENFEILKSKVRWEEEKIAAQQVSMIPFNYQRR